MNLNELLEKAAALPWRSARSHEDKNGPMFELKPGQIMPITQIYDAKGNLVMMSHSCFDFRGDDIALLLHCVNRFGGVVAALKEALELLNYIAAHPKAWETIHGRAVDARSELSPVLESATQVTPGEHVTCPVCDGSTISKVTGRACTRCEGRGMITKQLAEVLLGIRKDLEEKLDCGSPPSDGQAPAPSVSSRDKAVWAVAMTLAHNMCIQDSDRINSDDGPLPAVQALSEEAARIRGWMTPDDLQLLEMFAEAGLTNDKHG